MKKTALAHLRRHGPLSLTLWQACADLDENPLTKGVVSSDQARRGYKAATDAALGRGSQALTEWIEGLR
jgi:hypothetical protein